MEIFQDPVVLSRFQFAVTAMFHILWPVLTVGLSVALVIFEGLWLKTGDVDYYRHARFWGKLFVLNFSIGVISGVPLEFEFGTNWSRFSTETGEFFGNILGYEGAMAFMLEAGFLGIMLFGWSRVPPGIHWLATCMVALGASLSVFWILVANSWMQTPAGIHLDNHRVVVDSYMAAIFNKSMVWSVLHMWFACMTTSLFVIGGVSAWYIQKRKYTDFFLKSFKLVLLGAIFVVPAQIVLGHLSGMHIFINQPAKAAAVEAHWETNQEGQGASWNVLAWPNQAEQKNDWAITVPNVLSLLATGSRHGRVEGLSSFPPEDQPTAIGLIYYSFRIMVASGLAFLGLLAVTSVAWWKGGLSLERVCNHRLLLRAWIASIPLGYLATECGWIVREVGRQPWVIYGVLRTHDAASNLPASVVATTLGGFIAVYGILLILFMIFAARIIRKGPDLSFMPPSSQHLRETADND
ncbi:cytochrome ubiquinol oxidase subunit I [Methylomicrobium sp. Wu6]|uniref:cytochrome ubiquinol oxidase subunit I n=1 Tax=Methylomicrobium sp. Wu6 TaxID=3107928 RepID=UPI002DD68E1A|nr:cytochrome ubiquinol oxidase subunit I [Methylomicrobium sp. Wu6]MEC4748940.1 cytochrome ubiquinol oxidase subunit I [Methylomicrobium sp. Wu6]